MLSDERKHRQLQALGKKESTFLRLKRTKLGLADFRTVKVIGKGAFGEVCGAFQSEMQNLLCIGPARSKSRYGQDIRYEAFEEG